MIRPAGDVRPVAEVLRDVRLRLLSGLNGQTTSPEVTMAWNVIGQAGRMFEESVAILEDATRGGDVQEWQKWREIGQQFATSKIIRAVADELGISNFREVGSDE